MALHLTLHAPVAAEQTCFGFYELREGVPHAVPGEVWTFDHGADPNEGWVGENVYDAPGPNVVRWRTLEDFADDGLPPGAPIIDGTGMIWAGVHEAEALEHCYECGLGFGFGSGRVRSPWIPYSSGDLELAFDWFLDAPAGMYVMVQADNDPHLYLYWGFEDLGTTSWDAPLRYSDVIEAEDLEGASAVRVELLFTSPGGPSDEDCTYDSVFGAFGVDNVVISGGASASYDFEGGPQGWESLGEGGLNRDPVPYFEVRDVTSYGAEYENWCDVSDNVMTFHGPGLLPEDRRDGATSPILDFAPLGLAEIDGLLLHMDRIEDYPGSTKPGIWVEVYVRQFPVECATGGPPRWSNWRWVHSGSVTRESCVEPIVNLKSGVSGLPEQLQIHIAVHKCAACCVTYCEGSGLTPLIDNLEVCVTGPTSSVDGEPGVENQEWLQLSSHPLGAESRLRFAIPAGSGTTPVRADLFDLSGRHLGSLHDAPEGRPEVAQGGVSFPIGRWMEARGLSAGTYLLRVSAENRTASRKVVWTDVD